MKSMWIRAFVHPLEILLADGEREAMAERNVAGGVLVEQRVVEDGAKRADPTLAVDQRELAEQRGALVER